MASSKQIRNRKAPRLWTSEAEWLQVYDALSKGGHANVKRAISQLKAWAARSHTQPSLSFPLEATLDILECNLLTEEEDSGSDGSQHIRCLSYAMTVNRFVNGANEYGLAKGYAGSIMLITGKFGIPSWLVDTRHAAAHGLLPPVATLRTCLDVALTWLTTEYWDAVAAQLKSRTRGSAPLPVTQLKSTACQVFEECARLSQEPLQRYTASRAVNELKFLSTSALVEALKRSHFLLVPLRDEANQRRLLKEVLKTHSVDSVDSNLHYLPTLPQSAISFWHHVLKRTCSSDHSFLSNLSLALVQCVHSDVCSYTNLIRCGGWLRQVLQDFRSESTQGTIHWPVLLEACKKNPGPLTGGIMKIVVSNLKGHPLYSPSQLEQLMRAAELLTVSERLALCLPSNLEHVKLKGDEDFVEDLLSLVRQAKKSKMTETVATEQQMILQKLPQKYIGGSGGGIHLPSLSLPRSLDQMEPSGAHIGIKDSVANFDMETDQHPPPSLNFHQSVICLDNSSEEEDPHNDSFASSHNFKARVKLF